MQVFRCCFRSEYIGFIPSNSYFQGRGYHPARDFELLLSLKRYKKTQIMRAVTILSFKILRFNQDVFYLTQTITCYDR
jgi:hypothetical protein